MLTSILIGNKIAEARKQINISQAQLAQRLFISSQAVGKWERGESMPDIITFNRLAEILAVDLNYFSENFHSEIVEITLNEPHVIQSAESPTGEPKKKLNWDMSHGNWLEADFSGLKNLHEKFSSSNMQKCLFVGSEMLALLLKNNNVNSCDFTRSDISASQIQRSNLFNNLLVNCSLNDTEFSESYITACDFTGANFTGAIFKSGGFQNNKIANAVWNRTTFKAMHLVDVVFDGKIEDCYFENCAFKKVTFNNATLINSFFKNKSLKGIKFIDCQADRLTYEFLKNGKANLTGIALLSSENDRNDLA